MLSILQSGKEWRYAVKSICVHTWFSMQSVRAPDEVVVIAGGRRPCFIFSPPSSLLSISKDFCLTSLGLPMGSTLGLSWISVAVVIHVCPLTQLSSVCFLHKKILVCLLGKSMTPHGMKYSYLCSFQQSWPLEGILWADMGRHPSRALNLNLCIALGNTEIQTCRLVSCVKHGGPRTLLKQLMQTWIVCLQINALF